MEDVDTFKIHPISGIINFYWGKNEIKQLTEIVSLPLSL